MKSLIIAVLTIIFLTGLTIHSESFAAWWLEEYFGENRKEIPDKEFQFKLDDIKCVVSETNFWRAPNDAIDEHRDLTCWVSNDTVVTVRAHCNFPLYSLTDFQIRKKGKLFWPALFCGKKK